MEAASPDLEKQGFFAVVFVNREYSGQPDLVATILLLLTKNTVQRGHAPIQLYIFETELLFIKNESILEKKQIIKYCN